MDKPLTARIDSYEAAVTWLFDRIDYERIRPASTGNPFRLERIARLLQRIGSPHHRIPAVHIAGTKGKGSTAAMTDAILRCAGIRTGLFTSPHIQHFEERMKVSGRMPAPAQLLRLVSRLNGILQAYETETGDRPPTFFEITTLLGWMLFDEEGVEIAVLETGLGGRLDCTNVCVPLVTVITSIGLDHTHILGDTIAGIASEKAGIIKRGVPVVQGVLPEEADRVIAERAINLECQRLVCGRDFAWHSSASERTAQFHQRSQNIVVNTPTRQIDELLIPLLGQHQADNASLAVMTAELLCQRGLHQIDATAVRNGLAATDWPLRFEVCDGSPTIVLDAAHNPDSIRAVVKVLRENEWQHRRRVLVFAASADKDAHNMLRIIMPEFDQVILTRFEGNPRSVSPEQLFAIAASLGPTTAAQAHVQHRAAPAVAISEARRLAGEHGLICVTGSLFLAAEVRTLLKQERMLSAKAE